MFDPKDLDQEIDNMADKTKISEPGSLLETAEVLTQLQAIEPSSERRAELREQFLVRGQELGETRQRRAQTGLTNRWRLLTARRIVATAAMLVFSSGSVVYAAADSMPNGTLYPIKRTSETIALSVTTGETQNRLRNVFAKRRLKEARYLIISPGNSGEHAQAIPLLIEARKSGDPGLKNQVDELLEAVTNRNNKKAADRPDGRTKSKNSKPRNPGVHSNQPDPASKDLPETSPRNDSRPNPSKKNLQIVP